MRYALLATLLLLTLPALAMAQPLHELLALLRHQEQSWWRHFRVAARAGARVSPGEDGSGIDTRAAREFSQQRCWPARRDSR
jgi:hypothetical protein